MIWYSSNNIVPNKINEKSSEYHESYLSLEKIDRHLVWDEAMKKSLSKITRKPIYAIGSLMFYPKIETIKKQKTETINIVVFDITPPKSKINTEENFGYESQAIETLKQIINVIEKIKVRSQKDLVLTLKSKREFGRAHSKMYRHYVKLLKRKRVIHLLDPKTNLYDVIGGADLVICFPWTSPGIIAVELGVPCIYYISDREKIWNLENPRKFNLCRTESELYSSLERNLEL